MTGRRMIALYILENLLFPPALTVLLTLLAWLAMKRGRVSTGRVLLASGLIFLYLLSLPFTSRLLSRSLETYPPLDTGQCTAATKARAIVTLAYERDDDGREYGHPTSAGDEMERLRYAAHLYHCYHLPVFVVGGDALETGVKQADLMRHTLETYFHVPVTAGDGQSQHTWDNARYAWNLLQTHGIREILLVTHAWHMARAVRLFRDVGFTVQPAPTRFTSFSPISRGIYAWIPTPTALRHNKRLFHEVFGLGLHWLKNLETRFRQ